MLGQLHARMEPGWHPRGFLPSCCEPDVIVERVVEFAVGYSRDGELWWERSVVGIIAKGGGGVVGIEVELEATVASRRSGP